MYQSQTVHRKLLFLAIGFLFALAVLLVTITSSARAAEQYGEITRFGTVGDSEGSLDEARTRAIGVDPSNNSVYVVDEPEAPSEEIKKIKPTKKEVEACVKKDEEEEEEPEPGKTLKQECEEELTEEIFGPTTRHLRLQKFTESGGAYTLSASVRFTDVSEGFEEVPQVALGIEGVAVDPTDKRVYLLAADARKSTLSHDGSQLKGGAEVGLLTASTLYAFSTEAVSGKLVGAGTEGPGKEVLAGPAALQAQSEQPGKALLGPEGITVDPNTGEVIVLGHIDETGAPADNLESATDHFALQRITSSGTLGERYVDSKNVLKGGAGGLEELPSSPTVASASGAEHVYVLHEGLIEIPYDFEATTAPKVVAANPPRKGVERGVTGARFGGQLSASPPEGSPAASTLYGRTNVFDEALEEEFAGVLAVSPSGSELGWTGGQSVIEPAEDKDDCALEPTLATLPIDVAAGSGGKVFALAPEFLQRKEKTKELKPPFFDAVVEFGPAPPPPPGPVGCPEAHATEPVAKINGHAVPKETAVEAGKEVTFSSEVKQADALKVEWEFGDGSAKQTVTEDEFQTTKGVHIFTKASPAEGYLVKEIIHTDDLATPEVIVERKIKVSGEVAPEAKLEGPTSAKVNESVTFSDPDQAGIEKYEWEFGDGSKKETTTAPQVKHSYAKPGEYKVSLTVTSVGGAKATAKPLTITVTEEHKEEHKVEPPKEEHKVEPPKEEPKTLVKEEAKVEVKDEQKFDDPEAKLASVSLLATSSGTVVVEVTCPTRESSCAGSVTLRTLSAVVASARAGGAITSKAKKAILTLASGSFTVAGGQMRKVTVHLSKQARELLAKVKVLRAKATIVAHDPSGVTRTTQATVTLRLAKSRKKP
ncbi:MAG: PKD domain-containing protein [Solirubrobacteraceae bacterium]